MLGQKKLWVQKYFWSEKNLVQKKVGFQKINFRSKKIVGPKKFESEKYLESKIFGPSPHPYGIGLSMVG